MAATATPQEKTAQANETRTLRTENEDYSHDLEELIPSSGCGGCFRGVFRCRHGYLLQPEEKKEGWVKRNSKKLEEVLAGPKWKTLIRRFIISVNTKNRRSTTMQYDIQSYELNFDEGIHRSADGVFLFFSARFASPSGINKG